ncbi:MAG: integrase [Hyphomicrobiales bacterium]|nr:MAG: integrase [Hyphomicrobiales bacterium]
MSRRRFLPRYVSGFRDRHGKERLRYRRKGYASHYFTAALGTEEFREEYRACDEARLDSAQIAIARTAPGTIDDLVTRYFAVPTRLGPTLTTQAKVRRIIERFREEHGHRMVADVRFEHIDTIVGKKRVKVQVGPRTEGGIEAARKLRKELVRLFDFAIKLRMRSTNPVAQAERVKVAAGERSLGYHTWTEAEITRYRDHHHLGTKGRLAMELMLWTGQRRSDAIQLGPQHIHGRRLRFRQGKTGKVLELPIAPPLQEAIDAMPKTEGHLCFLVTEWGKPFSNAGFGNWFRDQCDAAGLSQCTAHGLRKATMRRMAELGMGNQSLKSVSGHSRDNEVAHYTRAANQGRMAEDAIGQLADWETDDSAAKPSIENEKNV